MTKKLKNSKHSKTSVLKFLQSTLFFFSLKVGLSNIEISEPSAHVHGTDEENNLCPSQSGDGVDSGYTVWYIGAGDSRGDIESPAEELGDNVSDYGELGDTSVYEIENYIVRLSTVNKMMDICIVIRIQLTLELGSAVLVEFLLINVLGEAQRIKEPSGGNNSELVLEPLDGGGCTALLGGGEGGGRAGDGSEGGEFHHLEGVGWFVIVERA
jgi:hypothetical protein